MKIFNEKKGISDETEDAPSDVEETGDTDGSLEAEEVLVQDEQPAEPENNSQEV